METLTKEDMDSVGRVADEKKIVKVSDQTFLKSAKGIFTQATLSRIINDYGLTKIPLLTLEGFLIQYADQIYAEVYEEREIDQMLLEATQNNSIELTPKEVAEVYELASQESERHLYYDDKDETLVKEISARPNILYDLPHGDWVGNGQFFKIKNRIYYVLGNDPTDRKRENLAYDFTDMPFMQFIAYVVLSYLVDGDSLSLSLQETRSSTGKLMNRNYWESVFCFLLDPRFQKECFRVLEINKVCKIHILAAWTNLLKHNFQKRGYCHIACFVTIYSESNVKTETYLERGTVCNLLEFLGVDPIEAVSLGDKSSSCKGAHEMILSLDRFLESR